MTKMIRLKQVVFGINRYFNLFGLTLLLLMIGCVLVDILSRALFNMPLSASYEIVEYIMSLVIVFALGYTQVRKGHINVMTVIELLPKKVQAVAERIINLIASGFYFMAAWQTFLKGGMDKIAGHTSAVLFIPKYPFVYAASLGFLLIALVLLMQAIVPDDESDASNAQENEPVF